MDFSNAIIKGAGGYGIVVAIEPKNVWKLYYNSSAHSECVNEVEIQYQVTKYISLFPEISIPQIYRAPIKPVMYQGKSHLCGFEMDYMEPPRGFNEQVHMLLGYKGDDIDQEWGARSALPVGPTNPTRGFFASPETLEAIWKEEGSNMTIEDLAFIMGKTYRNLLEISILPIDLEWVWSNGKPALLDFGLCEFVDEDSIDPYEFLHQKGLRGLANDFYLPHQGDRGYEEFMRGFDTVYL